MDRDLMLLWVIIVGIKLITFSCGRKKVVNHPCCSGWFSPLSPTFHPFLANNALDICVV